MPTGNGGVLDAGTMPNAIPIELPISLRSCPEALFSLCKESRRQLLTALTCLQQRNGSHHTTVALALALAQGSGLGRGRLL